MSINPEHIEDGTSDAMAILGRYTDAGDINAAIFGDLSDFDLEEDVEDALQTYASSNTTYWDGLYIADPGEYAGEAVTGFVLDVAGNTLEAQKALSLTITNSVKALTSVSVSIEQAVVEYIDDMPVKTYVEKATGKIVISETVLSETTHIPYGKFLAGAGHAVQAYAIFETFKDTIIASYNATTGQEDTFTPLQEYLIASTMVVTGGRLPQLSVGQPSSTMVGGFAGAVAGWTADRQPSRLGGDAKAASKTLQQTLDDAYAEIKAAVNDAWDATGQTADDILDAGQGLLDDVLDGIKDLAPDLELPPIQLPDWLVPRRRPSGMRRVRQVRSSSTLTAQAAWRRPPSTRRPRPRFSTSTMTVSQNRLLGLGQGMASWRAISTSPARLIPQRSCLAPQRLTASRSWPKWTPTEISASMRRMPILASYSSGLTPTPMP